jgi:excisionase family DNA binding protein
MLNFAPLPAATPKRTLADKQKTKERLTQELADDLAATAGQLRHTPPAPSGSSRNPNETLMFDLVDSSFLNREAHEEAKAIQEAWKPQPWKGFIWYGHIHEPNSKPERVWTEPSMNLQWTGAEWKPYKRQDGTAAAPVGSVPSNVSIKLYKALQRSIKVGKSGGIVNAELNETYAQYLADPTGQRDSLFVTISAFVRSDGRIWEINGKYGEKAEISLTLDDIFDEFAIDLMHRIENNQYKHIGKMQNWIRHIWKSYFFPDIQTAMNAYIDRTLYVNQTAVDGVSEDDEDYEHQDHSVAIKDIEGQQVRREEEGYYCPISRHSIFPQMSRSTQAMVQMLADGLKQNEIAVRLNIGPRQLSRRMNKAIEEGETLRSAVLHSVQGCADEGNMLERPKENSFSISACADETQARFLTPDEAAIYLGALNSRTLTRWAREGYIPAIPIGEGKRRLWRFLESDLEEWMLARRQGGQNAA